IWKDTGSKIAKVILEKKNKVLGISLPNLNMYYISMVIRNMCYWWRNRHLNQWNRIENPEIDPHEDAQLIFGKDEKPCQWRKDGKNSLFNKSCWESWMFTCKKMKLDFYLTLYTKIS
ncbi:LORF2 protein, partial [Crocuta crocuta]